MTVGTPRHRSHPTSPALSPGGRVTVLIVEHCDAVFAPMADELRKRGLRVLRARNAVQGLAKCVRAKPEILVTNSQAPDQSGWLLIAKLRMTDQLPRNAVVYGLSRYAQAAKAFGVRVLPCLSAGSWRYADVIVQGP